MSVMFVVCICDSGRHTCLLTSKIEHHFFFSQTFIEKLRGYAVSLFRKASSHTCKQNNQL